jgi:putative endonuclease
MQGYVYVLQSDTSGRYYIGSAVDPDRRLKQHNADAVTATRGRGPWRSVKTLAFPTEFLARKAEHYLKRQKSRRILEAVIDGRFIWPHEFGL